jgi:asparagine synthase (glutamine-hydrolysing)
MLSDECLKKTGLFNPKRVGKLLDKYRKGEAAVNNEVQNMAIVGILSTQLVQHQFIDNFPWKKTEPLEPDKIIRMTN